MLSQWNAEDAERFASDSHLGLRVYSSQLLGRDADLVLHGGGNTSVKGEQRNVFGEIEQVLYVKGSGWDLQSIAAGGFAPVRLQHLQALAELQSLSDTDMMRELRLALLDPAAPTPSVEAILHALVPLRYVDHTHADAVVAISNSPNGESALQEIYGDEVLVLPYVMPGFILAKQVCEATRDVDWSRLRGIVLLHHGIITFDDDCKTSYENMIELVSRAEDYLRRQGAWEQVATAQYTPAVEEFQELAKLRQQAARLLGRPLLLRWNFSEEAVGFATLSNVEQVATRGPLTPDHSIHTKPFSALFDADLSAGLEQFGERYQAYFDRHAADFHTCLDLLPRTAVWQGKGMLYFAFESKRLNIVADISAHTVKAIQWGEKLGAWTALSGQDQFDLEYWELEQAKLKRAQSRSQFEGRVVLVTGAASGIGKACVESFKAQGAAVIALDISATVLQAWDSAQVFGVQADVTDEQQMRQAIQQGIAHFGGIDILVSNAGSFPPSLALSEMNDTVWEHSLTLNLSSHMRLLRNCSPYLANGLEPSVIFIGSKNVPAPGPGAGAYSVAKAGLAQLARVAALELGGQGIRVNTIHPNAVFDTGIWTDEVLAQRAAHYKLSVDDYKKQNVLGKSVSANDVATLAVAMAGSAFGCTTGAQVAVDGGNDRVI